MQTVKVFVHTGHLSVDNEAVYPLRRFTEIAEAAACPRTWGNYYGADFLEVPTSDWEAVETLLIEEKMLYRVEGQHSTWQNVRTDEVRRRISFGA